MITKIIDCKTDFDSAIEQAVKLLEDGMPLIFPTETVYGIGVDIFNAEAVDSIYKIKTREFSKPLSAHIGSIENVTQVAIDIPVEFYILAEKFLPGPLNIILKKNKAIPDNVTFGLDTIGIRVPSNKFFQTLSGKFRKPIAATSANLSNHPEISKSAELIRVFNGLVPMIIDDGTSEIQKSSTVISLAEKPFRIYREGTITKSMIENELGIGTLKKV